MKKARSENSLRLQLDLAAPAVTSRVTRSSATSPAESLVASGDWVALRMSACTRASSSEKAKGFVR